ncbi:RNA polymerase sigma factor [Streptomyces sp. NRRL WC-3742]|uniref:RNA polymerase sigma factor n=1 Tax=Streptomyces sp. NRRL WC-3742 TaxID=1463934 RepID=UPI0007C547ED|nr:sigma-70 family RNA polymerase sigma factor [Streptomyces sp. NRRL WC-3742]
MHVTTLNELVDRCLAGDQDAWSQLVDRYTPLVFAIARGHRLGRADCEDVVQTTWLRAVQHLGKLRSPERIAQWIATSARRESLKCLEKSGRSVPVGEPAVFDRPEPSENHPEERVLTAEQGDEVLLAFCELTPRCQALLSLLVADPPMPYDEIVVTLGMARGSIGPIRGRCLAHLEKIMRQRAGRSPQDAELIRTVRETGLQAFSMQRAR